MYMADYAQKEKELECEKLEKLVKEPGEII